MKINLHCLSFLSFIQKIPTYHWSKTIESGEKISWWNKCFHYFMLAPIIGTQLLQRPFPRVTALTHFCVYFDVCFGLLSWWKIQTRPIIRFLTEAVRFWFFICWYLIESMMPCIWTRCSGPLAEKQAHNIKDPAVYLTVDMGYFFIPVCTKLIWWVCCQKALFFSFIWP